MIFRVQIFYYRIDEKIFVVSEDLNFLGDVLKVFEIARIVIFDFQLKFKWNLIWIQILI